MYVRAQFLGEGLEPIFVAMFVYELTDLQGFSAVVLRPALSSFKRLDRGRIVSITKYGIYDVCIQEVYNVVGVPKEKEKRKPFPSNVRLLPTVH